jgi:hypothetical protein
MAECIPHPLHATAFAGDAAGSGMSWPHQTGRKIGLLIVPKPADWSDEQRGIARHRPAVPDLRERPGE